MTLIKTLTASSSGTLSFVDGASSVVFDGTYKEYIFTFSDIHAGTNDANFTFQASTNGGSGYGVTTQSTFYRAVHGRDGSSGTVSYETDKDLTQSTDFQRIGHAMSATNNTACLGGMLHIFEPANTTFVKHFIARGSVNWTTNPVCLMQMNGYFNIISIDAMQFKMSSGNIDAGTIKLYGVK